jgi:hypothetical protein
MADIKPRPADYAALIELSAALQRVDAAAHIEDTGPARCNQ